MKQSRNPRILVVTPEVTYLPNRMGSMASYLTAKAGGLADVSAALINALFDQGADVHVALPDYRSLFSDRLAPFIQKEYHELNSKMPQDRIHLAEDRAFYYLNRVYSDYWQENIKLALAFQREVINNIVPRVRPDLIHCNDWMTGLIPAMSRRLNIPCLFTVHNIHTMKCHLSLIEDRGIDAAYFWNHLYYERIAHEYEAIRENNPVDFLTSGIFAAHFVNTVSQTFLLEVVEGRHSFVEKSIQNELTNKWRADCAVGILNAPDPAFNPAIDPSLHQSYGPDTVMTGKQANKQAIQKLLGLIEDVHAPIFFWPSRLDSIQKGSQLLSDILFSVVSRYWDNNLQIIFVANGEYQQHFRDIALFHGIKNRVAVCDFSEQLEHLAYGAADFILMPSLFEPCGLPQMIAPIYGALPVAHDTGGIHDTIIHLDVNQNRGNGFLFRYFDSIGLSWAIDQAMSFYVLPESVRIPHIQRIMTESLSRFNHEETARQYIDLYEKMLQRPLINMF